MREQGLIFLLICLLGFGFGFLYDVLRIFRLAFGVSKPLSMAEDFIYWVFAAFGVFYFLLGVNYGEVRLYMVLGFMGGMILYYLSVSPPVMRVSLSAVNKVKRAVFKIFGPFLILGNKIKLQLKKTEKQVIIYISTVFKKIFALRGRLKRHYQNKRKKKAKKIKQKGDS